MTPRYDTTPDSPLLPLTDGKLRVTVNQFETAMRVLTPGRTQQHLVVARTCVWHTRDALQAAWDAIGPAGRHVAWGGPGVDLCQRAYRPVRDDVVTRGLLRAAQAVDGRGRGRFRVALMVGQMQVALPVEVDGLSAAASVTPQVHARLWALADEGRGRRAPLVEHLEGQGFEVLAEA